MISQRLVTVQPVSTRASICAPRTGAPMRSRTVLTRFKDDRQEDIQTKPFSPFGVTKPQEPKETPYPEGYKIAPGAVGFTKRRELIVGRLAMIGVFAAGVAEWLLPGHPGVINQVASLGQNAGLPIHPAQVALAFGAIILYSTIGALTPSSPTWNRENQRDVASRPQGPNVVPKSALEKSFWGVTGFGFTKPNEIFHGRIAMLGFLAIILQQLRIGGLSGPGPLAQIANLLGGTADESFYQTAPIVFLAWSVLWYVVAAVNGKTGQQEDDTVA